MRIFLGVTLVYMISMIGGNTIWNSLKSLEKTFMVENVQAVEVITITWQDQVKDTLRDFGIDVDRAWSLAMCESNLQPDNFHINKDGSIDRGLFMINSKYHPEVTKECAYDSNCATIEFIRILNQRGCDEWVAYGNTCYERELKKLQTL